MSLSRLGILMLLLDASKEEREDVVSLLRQVQEAVGVDRLKQL